MAEMTGRRLRLWEDEPEERAVAENSQPEGGALALLTAEDGDGLVVTGATGSGSVLEVPAEIGGQPVVAIGTSAFRGNVRLQRVVLPDGLRRVGRCAFQGCAGLRELKLPRRMEQIGESAFQGCAALEALELPAGLSEIADRAFYGCGSLRRVAVPVGVLRIGERAFSGCGHLEEALLPDGLEAIAPMAFWGCGALKAVHVPTSVTELSANALPRTAMSGGQCFLTPQAMLVRAEVKRDYALPRGTRNLAGWALAGNESLLSVDFGEALERVGPYALAECVCLKRAALPPSVREVGRGAFSDCRRMTRARLSPSMKAIAGETFLRCHALEEVTLFPGIESIGERAFEDCRSLEALALPEGVVSVGRRAFYRCSSLRRLELPASLRELGPGALSGCNDLRVLVLKGPCDGEMQAVLADARRAAIVAPAQSPEAFPGLWRKRVCLGYALAAREGIPYALEAARACLDWMRGHSAAFIAEALRDVALMHLLVDGDCLSLESVQALLERADGPDRDEYYVSLLEYRNRRFGDRSAGAMSLW